MQLSALHWNSHLFLSLVLAFLVREGKKSSRSGVVVVVVVVAVIVVVVVHADTRGWFV